MADVTADRRSRSGISVAFATPGTHPSVAGYRQTGVKLDDRANAAGAVRYHISVATIVHAICGCQWGFDRIMLGRTI